MQFLLRKLIGVVINTTFSWNNENAILSLVANFRDIAREFLQQSKSKMFKMQAVQPTTQNPCISEIYLMEDM